MSLTELFAGQARFAHPTSPLMASLSLAMARVIGAPDIRAHYEELERSVASPNPHEPALRLAAALHEWVLLDDPRARGVRRYYASVAAAIPVDDAAVQRFSTVFRGHFGELCESARQISIQTNETSRGLVWLLPAAMILAGRGFYLVELGGSAGLNTMADGRHYLLQARLEGKDCRVGLGEGRASDIVVEARGVAHDLELLRERAKRRVSVAGRWCFDRAPLDPTEADVARRLMACVWGDQVARIAALRRGLKLARDNGPPVERVSVRFPEQLDAALAEVPRDRPMLVFHTYVRAYLGASAGREFDDAVAAHVAAWPQQALHVWLEPETQHNPICSWSVASQSGSVEIARAHPHLAWIEFRPGALGALAQLSQP